jgi:hypothetical protein
MSVVANSAFFIDFPLGFIRFTRTDNPKSSAVRFANNNQKHAHHCRNTDNDDAFGTRHVGCANRIRIGDSCRGFLEADAVFAVIGRGVRGQPFKASMQHQHHTQSLSVCARAASTRELVLKRRWPRFGCRRACASTRAPWGLASCAQVVSCIDLHARFRNDLRSVQRCACGMPVQSTFVVRRRRWLRVPMRYEQWQARAPRTGGGRGEGPVECGASAGRFAIGQSHLRKRRGSQPGNDNRCCAR